MSISVSAESVTSYDLEYVAMNDWIVAAIGKAKNAPTNPPTAPPAIAAPNATPALSSMVFALMRGLR